MPSNDTDSPDLALRVFGYNPTPALSILAMVIYAIVGSALLFRLVKTRAWWGLCLPIGAFFEALGFLLKYVAKFSPNSVGLFAIENLFIVCAPAAFLAFNYIIYGHLISHIGAEHSIINPQKVAKFFVISDVCTFLIQAGGSALETSANQVNTGQRITLVGLILQFGSYCFFCVLLIKSHRSIKAAGLYPMHRPCIRVISLLYFSSAFLIIRSIYRVAEFAQGQGGYLLTHEAFLYVLDTLPLLVAIIVYIPYWPVVYLEHDVRKNAESLEMNAGLVASQVGRVGSTDI